MRFIIHNPQGETHFGTTLLNFITKSPSFKKYKYILDYLLKTNVPFIIYVDRNGSSLPPNLRKFLFYKIEVYIWLLVNKINPLSVNIHFDTNKFEKDDIFFSFIHNFDSSQESVNSIKNQLLLKIFHTTHYVMNTTKMSITFKKINGDFLIGENNLYKNCTFFRKHFSYYKRNVYTLPFVFQERFKNTQKFASRTNKCLATGTVVNISQTYNANAVFKEFIEFYKINTLHPIRSEIYKNKDKLKDIIDSYIGLLWDKKPKREYKNAFQLIYNKFFNAFVLAKRDYFKFDIVEKYNQYKMFVIPEEINDLPGIGFVEGMACGCAYIGKIDPMYTDLGLKPWKHFIGYDGTLEDLTQKIKYYQKHQKELAKIASTGCKYVRTNFNGHAAAKTFLSDLENLTIQYKKGDYKKERLKLHCSFTNK